MDEQEIVDKVEELESRTKKLETPTHESDKGTILSHIVLEWLEKHKDKSIGEIAALLYRKND